MFFFISINIYQINRDGMDIRRELSVQSRLRKLGNATKSLKYKKAEKEEIRKYVIALLVINYRNDPAKLKEEIKEVNQSLYKK